MNEQLKLTGYLNIHGNSPSILAPVVLKKGQNYIAYEATPSGGIQQQSDYHGHAATQRRIQYEKIGYDEEWTTIPQHAHIELRPTTQSLILWKSRKLVVTQNSDIPDVARVLLSCKWANTADPFLRYYLSKHTLDASWVAKEMLLCLTQIAEAGDDAKAEKWLADEKNGIAGQVLPPLPMSLSVTRDTLADLSTPDGEIARYTSRARYLQETWDATGDDLAIVSWQEARIHQTMLLGLAAHCDNSDTQQIANLLALSTAAGCASSTDGVGPYAARRLKRGLQQTAEHIAGAHSLGSEDPHIRFCESLTDILMSRQRATLLNVVIDMRFLRIAVEDETLSTQLTRTMRTLQVLISSNHLRDDDIAYAHHEEHRAKWISRIIVCDNLSVPPLFAVAEDLHPEGDSTSLGAIQISESPQDANTNNEWLYECKSKYGDGQRITKAKVRSTARPSAHRPAKHGRSTT